MCIIEFLGYKKNTFQTASSAPVEQEGRVGVVQVFDTEELREDIYYLTLENILDEECFSRQWVAVPLYRDERRRFVRWDRASLDGLLVIEHFTQKEMTGFHEYTDNIVFLDSSPEPIRYYSISSNYHLTVQLALKRLRINGHQLTAYLGGVNAFDNHRELTMGPRFYYYRTSQANRDGYDPSLVLDCEMNAKSGCAAVRNSLETYDRPPEAVFVTSDSIAPGAMITLWEQGLRVPEDISIVIFSDIVLPEYSDPPFTSIKLFMRESARVAAFCMQLLWQGSVQGKRIMVPCELASRGNVAPTPTDNPPSEL